MSLASRVVDVVIAGGHGQIARRLTRLLTARGDTVRAIVRHPDHLADVEQDGAEGVLLDLEQASLDAAVASVLGADAVVFAAGAGPGSGIPRKDSVDRAASVLMADASERAGVRRFVQISSMGTDRARSGQPTPGTDDVFAAYLRAKAAAEDDLRRRDGLRWTVLRPGRLVNDPGTGLVSLETQVPRGQVARDDVAAVVAALLPTDESAGMTLELTGGSTPVDEAVRRIVET